MRASRLRLRGLSPPSGLGAYYLLLIVLLYLPILLLLLFSVNSNTVLTFPLRGLTTRWYEAVVDTPGLLRAARNSLLVAAGSSLVATLLGTMISLLAMRYSFRGKLALIGLAVLPLIVPFVVLGVSLLLLFSALGLDRSLWTVGVAHTVVAIPYVLLIVMARLSEFDPGLEEAAMDLGADYPTTLRRIVIPVIAPAMAQRVLQAFVSQAHRRAEFGDAQAELSPREIEVLELASEGATNKDIADRLYISVGTVKNHIHNILEKLHLKNRAQIAAYNRLRKVGWR